MQRMHERRNVLVAAAVIAVGSIGLAVVASVRSQAVSSASGSTMAGMAGMAMPTGPVQGARYWNSVSGGAFKSDGKTRTYYIGADKVVWNYAPMGRNEITGKPFDAVADTYVKTGPGRIGSRYIKCLYRGYTDGTFARLQRRPADQQYLGLLGPVIRAEVGDTIKVVFRNECPFPASIHPHGVLYKKSSEGAPYNDGTSGKDKADDEFTESNLMHSINGYVFGNMPMITLRKGERVRWYVMSMGTEVDLHTPHWHGNDVTVNGMRMDVISLLPASMVVADMVPDNSGIWLFHCHVNDHIRAGMLTRYQVTD